VADFRHRVELDAELPLHELGGRVPVLLDAVVGVAAVLDAIGGRLQRLADDRVRHIVVLADAEIEELAFGVFGQRLPLRPLDLLELVDLGPLAVVRSSDALGKERLKPGIGGHGGSLRMSIEKEISYEASERLWRPPTVDPPHAARVHFRHTSREEAS
jgi:hypothetical protein